MPDWPSVNTRTNESDMLHAVFAFSNENGLNAFSNESDTPLFSCKQPNPISNENDASLSETVSCSFAHLAPFKIQVIGFL